MIKFFVFIGIITLLAAIITILFVKSFKKRIHITGYILLIAFGVLGLGLQFWAQFPTFVLTGPEPPIVTDRNSLWYYIVRDMNDGIDTLVLITQWSIRVTITLTYLGAIGAGLYNLIRR